MTHHFRVTADSDHDQLRGDVVSVAASGDAYFVECGGFADTVYAAGPALALRRALTLWGYGNARARRLTDLTPAGFIIHDGAAIWGYGATQELADSMFRGEMQKGDIRLINEPTEEDVANPGDWARVTDFSASPATKALLAFVAAFGVNVTWDERDGVACMVTEA